MAKCSLMFFVLCSLLVLQLVTAYPEGNVDTPVGAPAVEEHNSKGLGINSSEENSDSKSASSSSEEKKDESHAAH